MPLLAAKLYVPAPRPRLVARPHLDERLNAGCTKLLTLICAPAGFGKTTLLSAWRAGPARDLSVAWLTLDENDNDPTLFLNYLVSALEQAQPQIGRTAARLLQSVQPPPPDVLVTPLLNDLSSVEEPWVLVLDDYHTIHNPLLHQAVAFLIEHLPRQLHLMIGSRMDPPLPLARLRVRDQLVEIRAADLRFSAEEANAFFADVMDLDLQPAEVTALEGRTEGWIAGLQLAALSMQRQVGHAEFIGAFTGSHRYVFDYLIEEVLQRQPEPLQEFLLQTSILDRLSGPLCDAVLDDRPPTTDGCNSVVRLLRQPRADGVNPSSVVLQELDRANLFLVPLDAERRWYRYHHLFGQLLRSQLQALEPERVSELHQRACDWYAANGFQADAIQHALAAGALNRAAGLVEGMAPVAYVRGEIATLLRWCQLLGEAAVSGRPALSLWWAAALSQTGQIDAAQARLSQMTTQELALPLQAGAAALRAGLACTRGDLPQAEIFAREALRLGDASEQQEAMPDNRISRLYALSTLVEVLASQGRLAEAISACQQALALGQPLARQRPWSALVGQLHLQLSLLHYERNELDLAAQHALAHLEMPEHARQEAQVAYGHAVLARALQAQGRQAEAAEQLEAAVFIAERWNASAALIPAMAQLVHIWVMRCDVAALQAWAEAYQARKGAAEAGLWPVTIRPEVGEMALAQALLVIGRPGAALALLEKLTPHVRAGAQFGRLIEVLALQALALQAQGQGTLALSSLDEALALAEPAGHFRLFMDAGTPMPELLTGWLRARRLGQLPTDSTASPDYVHRLLAAGAAYGSPGRTSLEPAQKPARREPWQPGEPLSVREAEVLRLVVAGCSNGEIGQQLFITTGTVKRHISSIFAKLDVRTRPQAIARARALQLA